MNCFGYTKNLNTFLYVDDVNHLNNILDSNLYSEYKKLNFEIIFSNPNLLVLRKKDKVHVFVHSNERDQHTFIRKNNIKLVNENDFASGVNSCEELNEIISNKELFSFTDEENSNNEKMENNAEEITKKEKEFLKDVVNNSSLKEEKQKELCSIIEDLREKNTEEESLVEINLKDIDLLTPPIINALKQIKFSNQKAYNEIIKALKEDMREWKKTKKGIETLSKIFEKVNTNENNRYLSKLFSRIIDCKPNNLKRNYSKYEEKINCNVNDEKVKKYCITALKQLCLDEKPLDVIYGLNEFRSSVCDKVFVYNVVLVKDMSNSGFSQEELREYILNPLKFDCLSNLESKDLSEIFIYRGKLQDTESIENIFNKFGFKKDKKGVEDYFKNFYKKEENKKANKQKEEKNKTVVNVLDLDSLLEDMLGDIFSANAQRGEENENKKSPS